MNKIKRLLFGHSVNDPHFGPHFCPHSVCAYCMETMRANLSFSDYVRPTDVPYDYIIALERGGAIAFGENTLRIPSKLRRTLWD